MTKILMLVLALAVAGCAPHRGYRDSDCVGQWPTWICIAGG